ncbi:hypothetical protein Sme01_66260 [Sphaerisporangium melleum]|uniref:Uncharacterized protein n=1 Tax=Sphaerisporangium melleum TaxID=321316 RepID=A0A917RFQ8_9ACTN|nr:hypothetical protein [Sphaerisporangium melleum]GGL04287.1 hypothetical protein GCM10007964_53000 [Sphaerisporangium melleum]GII74150.1 hypothetical protein Sme01_66260 [Sphaerisporangium melleum]
MLASVTDGVGLREAPSVMPFAEAGHAVRVFVSVRRGAGEPRPRAIAACAPAFPITGADLGSVVTGFSGRRAGPRSGGRRPRLRRWTPPGTFLALSAIHHRLTPVQGMTS